MSHSRPSGPTTSYPLLYPDSSRLLTVYSPSCEGASAGGADPDSRFRRSRSCGSFHSSLERRREAGPQA